MTTLQRRIRERVFERRMNGGHDYELAHAAGLHPSVVSLIICDRRHYRSDDQRVRRLAEVLGITEAETDDSLRAR